MAQTSMTFYPVGNGDTVLITLADGAHLLVDCNFRADAEGEGDETYDVYGDILERLPKHNDGNPHLDAFILTHPDHDHCRGFEQAFWLGDPDAYESSEEHQPIIIDELWFAPRLLTAKEEGELSNDAFAFRREARRRLELHRSEAEAKTNPGNRLRVIGYSDNDELDGLDDILTVPGSWFSTLNGQQREDLELFILAPVKADTDEGDQRNDTSIVFAAHFLSESADPAIALFGGDTRCSVWERIWQMNRDDNSDALLWHLFLAPHHCSWCFFNEERYEDDPEPREAIMELVENRAPISRVVASCKPIKDDDDNPPHYAAAELWNENSEQFCCTSEFPGEGAPRPMVFRIDRNGISGPDAAEVNATIRASRKEKSIFYGSR